MCSLDFFLSITRFIVERIKIINLPGDRIREVNSFISETVRQTASQNKYD